MIPSYGIKPQYILNTEAERDASWGDGVTCYCRDTGNYYFLDQGSFKPIAGSTGSMTYPGAGIPISNGSNWQSSIPNNSTNWNTAYSWGQGLKLNQSTPQTVSNGTPVFNEGISVREGYKVYFD